MKKEINKVLKLLGNILYKNNGNLFVSCKKDTENKKSSGKKTKENRIMILLNCVNKKKIFIKNQNVNNFNSI